MTNHIHKIEVLSGPERRRGWSTTEKLAIVQETYEPDVTVSIVARRHGIQPNQLFVWRKLAAQGALTATASQEEVVPASEYRALQNQVKELQRLLGKKTMVLIDWLLSYRLNVLRNHVQIPLREVPLASR